MAEQVHHAVAPGEHSPSREAPSSTLLEEAAGPKTVLVSASPATGVRQLGHTRLPSHTSAKHFGHGRALAGCIERYHSIARR